MPFTSISAQTGESSKVRRSYAYSASLIQPQTWMLLLLSALLQVAAFPVAGPLPFWRSALAWIAITPFLVAILSPDKRGNTLGGLRAALLGYACGVLWYAGNCYWIYQTMYLYGGLPKPVSLIILLLFALYLGLYHALFAWAVVRVRSTKLGLSGALLLSPAIWVAVELARARITGFPWDLLGNSQVDNSLITRIAPLAGVMAISFVVAAVNACIASAFLLHKKRGLPPALAGALVALLCLLLGSFRKGVQLARGDTAYAVLMQENLSVGASALGTPPLSVMDELSEFPAMSLHPGQGDARFRLPPGVQPTLVIWPEAPAHFRSDDPYLRQTLAQLARTTGAAVIAGDLGVVFDPSAPKGYFVYDSASMFDSQGNERGRYDKIHLVPWGEYVPFKRFFAFAQKLTEGAGDMDPGHARTIFRTGGHAYGVFICYESIFGDEIREFVQNGAEVLVNISDDGWYGDTGAPWQHLNMARMRAIENNRYLLRSTNTGITTVIAPDGQVEQQAPRHVRGAFALPFGYRTGETIYTRFGDWFACLCALVTLAALAFSFARRVD